MKDVSFILTGRDDNYTGNFIERFEVALKSNLEILKNSNLNYEIIIVDFNPDDDKLLVNNPTLGELLKHDNIKNIIVDRSVVVDDGLCENGFYEYFGKNIAAIKSNGKLLFMTNADIYISDDIAQYLKTCSAMDKDECFYRLRYRQDVNLDKTNVSLIDLCSSDDEDSIICGGYSGDATIFSRKVFIEIATGYNENDPNHRTSKGQASMDGEILWNLTKRGISKSVVDLVYYHVTHQRQDKENHSYCKDIYTNRNFWGYEKYPIKIINKNTIKIYK